MAIDLVNLIENPKDPKNIYNLALTYLKKQNYNKAIEEFNKVLKLDKAKQLSVLVYPNLGHVYTLIEKFEQAIDAFEKGLKFKPDNNIMAFIYYNLGYIYSQNKNYGIAILLYRSSLEFKNDDVNTLYALAAIYESKLQYQIAKAVIDRILALDSNHEKAKNLLNKMNQVKPLHEMPGKMSRLLRSLGLVVVPYFEYKENIYLPMIIYIYPESPLLGQVKAGEIITGINISEKAEKNTENLINFLEGPPRTKVKFFVQNRQIEINRIQAITRPLPISEQLRVYTFWLQTFDERLVFLWTTKEENKKEIGTTWGMEFEGLVRGLEIFSNNPVYHFAYALMIEHLQPLSIMEEKKEIGLDYEIDLSKIPFPNPDNSIIQIFKDNRFNKTADFLAKCF